MRPDTYLAIAGYPSGRCRVGVLSADLDEWLRRSWPAIPRWD